MISAQNLTSLPDIPTLRRLTQSLATLDAILCPEWEMRYHSFDSRWAVGERMASLRNGSGDGWFLLFSDVGAILKGFAHDSPMADGDVWPSVLSEVPADFSKFLAEPAFSMQDTTFCVWRASTDAQWQRGAVNDPAGSDPDGSKELLLTLDGNPQTYQTWAEEYFGEEIDLDAVAHVYQQRPLTREVLKRLNTKVTLRNLAEDIAEIGYPRESSAAE